MSDAFELRHEPTRKAVFWVRVWPLALATVLLAIVAAGVVAITTQDLGSSDDVGSSDLITAWFLVGSGTLGAAYVLYRAWRTWPAVDGSLVVVRLDDAGPHLRKGSFQDDVWFHVPWSAVQAVTFTPLPVPDDAAPEPQGTRLLRFVPSPAADIPEGPPGMFDQLLPFTPRESVLAFVAVPTWDDDLRELLQWVREHRPHIRVEDTVPS